MPRYTMAVLITPVEACVRSELLWQGWRYPFRRCAGYVNSVARGLLPRVAAEEFVATRRLDRFGAALDPPMCDKVDALPCILGHPGRVLELLAWRQNGHFQFLIFFVCSHRLSTQILRTSSLHVVWKPRHSWMLKSGNRDRGHNGDLVRVSSESREIRGVGVDLNNRGAQTRLHAHLSLPTLQRITCSLLSTWPSRPRQSLSLHQTDSDFHVQLRIHLRLLWFPESIDPAESRETAEVGQVQSKSSRHARKAFHHLTSP